MKKGDVVEAKSGTQGWVKGIIVDVVDIYTTVPSKLHPGIITQGQIGYMVRFTEGKHAGEVIKLPDNYLRLAKGGASHTKTPGVEYTKRHFNRR
jgi:hypothetical protein